LCENMAFLLSCLMGSLVGGYVAWPEQGCPANPG
jgi:hypothetical protein